MEARKLREGENPLPLVEIGTPEGTKFIGYPSWNKSKKGKNVLSISLEIPKGGTLFPLTISLNNKEEILNFSKKKFTYLDGYKIFYQAKQKIDSVSLDCYFFKIQDREEDPTPKPKLELVKEWKAIHSPFTGKYRKGIEVQGLYGKETEWIQIERNLSKELIYKARTGKAKIGYFSTLSPDIVGLDLDFHNRENPWDPKELPKTLEAYESLVLAIRVQPSIVYRSPRGIHLFFKFTTKAPWEILRDRIREGLEELDEPLQAEILPSPDSSLRIDPIDCYLDPETLEPIEAPKLKDIKTYNLDEFFGYDLGEWKKPGKKRERAYSLKKQATLEALENSILPITKSNEIFKDCPLLPAYYKAGLTERQAIERVILLLKRSGYSRNKELLSNPKRLAERIDSAFRNFERKGYSFEGTRKERQLELRDVSFIGALVSQAPYSNRRKESFRTFLESLLGWIRYQQNLTPTEKEWFSHFYTYREGRYVSGYRIFSQKGWIPIPSTIFRKTVWRYGDFLSYLISKGVLRAETGYIVEKSQCRYFSFRELVSIGGGIEDLNQSFIESLRSLGMPQRELGEVLGVKQYVISRLLLGLLSREKTTLLREIWENLDPSKVGVFGDLKGYAKTAHHI